MKSLFSGMFMRLFAWWFGRKGWKLGKPIPAEIKQCVVVAAPHTSNWDFVYAMAALHLFKHDVKYLAKKELFKWPLKGLLVATGGISVERGRNTGMVDAIIKAFASRSELILLIAGEGTRGKVDKWKSGFYHVAVGANVPLLLGYLDYAKKEAGFSDPLYLTGDKETDAAAMRAFYANKTARHPKLFDVHSIRF